MLPAGFAFIPVVDLFKAHSTGHFFGLDAVSHSLHESVAGVRLHIDGCEWFHYVNKLLKNINI